MANPCGDLAFLWLLTWSLQSIVVSLLDKAIIATFDFHYPYFLSSLHLFFNCLGASFVLELIRRDTICLQSDPKAKPGLIQQILGEVVRKELDADGKKLIWIYSFIVSLNIAMGKIPLAHMTVSFNHIMKALIPALTIPMGLALGNTISLQRQVAIIPVIVGVAMACFGDMSHSFLGFLYACGAVFMAAIKVVASGEMLTGSLMLHPVDLLGHMAPLATVQCLLLSVAAGELPDIYNRWDKGDLSPSVTYFPFFMLFLSGVSSFILNICLLMANKLTSPLTLCITSDVRQVVVIVASAILFERGNNPVNSAGIFLVLSGASRYAYVAVQENASAPSSIAPGTKELAILEHDDAEPATDDDEDSGTLSLVSD